MFLASFPAGPLQTNCYLVGQPGGEHSGCTLLEIPYADTDAGITAAVLPGHGDRTTIGRERATNPYLQENML